MLYMCEGKVLMDINDVLNIVHLSIVKDAASIFQGIKSR